MSQKEKYIKYRVLHTKIFLLKSDDSNFQTCNRCDFGAQKKITSCASSKKNFAKILANRLLPFLPSLFCSTKLVLSLAGKHMITQSKLSTYTTDYQTLVLKAPLSPHRHGEGVRQSGLGLHSRGPILYWAGGLYVYIHIDPLHKPTSEG